MPSGGFDEDPYDTWDGPGAAKANEKEEDEYDRLLRELMAKEKDRAADADWQEGQDEWQGPKGGKGWGEKGFGGKKGGKGYGWGQEGGKGPYPGGKMGPPPPEILMMMKGKKGKMGPPPGKGSWPAGASGGGPPTWGPPGAKGWGAPPSWALTPPPPPLDPLKGFPKPDVRQMQPPPPPQQHLHQQLLQQLQQQHQQHQQPTEKDGTSVAPSSAFLGAISPHTKHVLAKAGCRVEQIAVDALERHSGNVSRAVAEVQKLPTPVRLGIQPYTGLLPVDADDSAGPPEAATLGATIAEYLSQQHLQHQHHMQHHHQHHHHAHQQAAVSLAQLPLAQSAPAPQAQQGAPLSGWQGAAAEARGTPAVAVQQQQQLPPPQQQPQPQLLLQQPQQQQQQQQAQPEPPSAPPLSIEEQRQLRRDAGEPEVDLIPPQCECCGSTGPLFLCKCRRAVYCNRDCQLFDTERHRPVCLGEATRQQEPSPPRSAAAEAAAPAPRELDSASQWQRRAADTAAQPPAPAAGKGPGSAAAKGIGGAPGRSEERGGKRSDWDKDTRTHFPKGQKGKGKGNAKGKGKGQQQPAVEGSQLFLQHILQWMSWSQEIAPTLWDLGVRSSEQLWARREDFFPALLASVFNEGLPELKTDAVYAIKMLMRDLDTRAGKGQVTDADYDDAALAAEVERHADEVLARELQTLPRFPSPKERNIVTIHFVEGLGRDDEKEIIKAVCARGGTTPDAPGLRTIAKFVDPRNCFIILDCKPGPHPDGYRGPAYPAAEYEDPRCIVKVWHPGTPIVSPKEQ